MSNWMTRRSAVMCGAVATVVGSSLLAQERRPSDDGFTFKSSVELVSVNATVTDSSGHFVSGLRAEDFTILEDGERQTITQFESERVPVSLGIVLDTSGSMAGEKIEAARDSIDRFLGALPDPQDEFFMYRFSADPYLVNDWTSDRQIVSRFTTSSSPARPLPVAPACSRPWPR